MIRRTTAGVAVLIAAAPLAIGGNFYLQRIGILVLLFTILALALNVVFGHTDQLFLFTGGLAGIGAYTTALLAMQLGISAWLTLPIGALAAGLVGLGVSFVAARRRLTVVIISILTLSLQLALHEFFIGARGITRGSSGFSWAGFDLDLVQAVLPLSNRLVLYYLMAVALVAAFVFYDWLIRSRFGLAFDAIRQDVRAASATGVDPVYYQSVAGFTGAVLIGIAGTLYAQLTGFVIPSMFTFLTVDAQVLIILILGGRRTTFGPLVGSVVLIAITELLRGTSELRSPILGLLLVVLFIYFPQGIVPWTKRRVGEFPLTLPGR